MAAVTDAAHTPAPGPLSPADLRDQEQVGSSTWAVVRGEMRRLYHSPRRYRRARQVVVGLWLATLVMCVAMVGGAVRNDLSIARDTGYAQAEVTGITSTRTMVRFQAQDGQFYSPTTGVLYPFGLEVGNRVEVEYRLSDPTLVKVAGRTWVLSLLPAGSTAAGASVVAIVLLYGLGLRRRLSSRQRERRAADATSDEKVTQWAPNDPVRPYGEEIP